MKLIVALIRPAELALVQSALESCRLESMTVSQVLDGRESEPTLETYRGQSFRRPATKLRVEIVVENSAAEDTVAAIQHVAGDATVLAFTADNPLAPNPIRPNRIAASLIGL